MQGAGNGQRQVVYISWMPLSEKVERDWCIAYLRERGVPVAYWDVTSLLLGEDKPSAAADRDYLVRVPSYHALEELLAHRDPKSTDFVMIVNYEARFNRLYHLLTRHGGRLFFFEWGNFPIKDRSRSGGVGMMLRDPARFARKLWEKGAGYLQAKLHPVKPFDVVLAAGCASMGRHPGAGKTIPINLCDYDDFQSVKESGERLVPGKYGVFLDVNLAHHTDLKLCNMQYLDPERYAASLARFFDLVEARYGMEVVIAAHPKASYGDRYYGRRSYKGATPELVRDAEFVITHHSTAISYAVLGRKPLVFIYTDEMARIYADTIAAWVGDLAEYLDQPLYNADRVETPDQIELRRPDPERYDRYKYNYLTTRESEHSSTRDIFYAAVTAEHGERI